MKRNFFYSLIIISVFISCKPKMKIVDLGRFTIQTPNNWKINKFNSDRGNIQIDSFEFVSFEYAENADDLEDFLKIPTTPFHSYTIYPPLSGYIDLLCKSKAVFENINDKWAKIVMPLETGHGVTGVYFDSVKISGNTIFRFEISWQNLRTENEKKIIEAIKTMKIHH